jgi:arabinose-5-phosphate isomerase
MKANPNFTAKDWLTEAKRVLSVEADALRSASDSLDERFAAAAEIFLRTVQSGGKIVLSGVGKSGNVAVKVAATLTSVGNPAVFLHPTDALHGDLGLLNEKDTLLVFSHSGSSQEILQLLTAAKPLCRGTVAIMGNPNGAIAGKVDVVVPAVIHGEACPDNLAPTASSTLSMAIGDAFAIALKQAQGFGPDHFARFHPGGNLGKRLLTLVQDLMHPLADAGMLPSSASMDEVVVTLTRHRLSGVCIVEKKGNICELAGVITEGDIRRALSHKEKFFQLRAGDIMTKNPKTILHTAKAADALQLMEQREHQISFLPVVDEQGGCVGIVRVHDLVLAGLA